MALDPDSEDSDFWPDPDDGSETLIHTGPGSVEIHLGVVDHVLMAGVDCRLDSHHPALEQITSNKT